MSFSSPSIPATVPPPNPATMADPSVAAAGARTQTQASGGIQSTIMTGGQGLLGGSPTSSKSLFGQ